MARPPRRGGLGSPGLERIRRELNTPLGQDSVLERALFPREEPTYEEDIYQTQDYNISDVVDAYSRMGLSFEDDFEVFYVMKSDVEGRGPQSSTRVASHKFFPAVSWHTIYEYLESSSSQLYPARIQGHMYVTWHKRSKNHSGTEYYGINLADYRDFFKSSSKGRDVRNFESSFANV
jgi:hypothetical protein